MKQEQKTHVSADALIQLLKGARSIRWQLALGVVMSLVLVVCALVIPTQMGALVQILIDYFDAPETGASVLAQLAPGLLALLGVYLLRAAVSYGKMQLLNRAVSRYFTCNLRIQISDKIQRLPVSFVDHTPVGDILSRMTEDVSRIGGSLHTVLDTITGGFLQILAIAVVMFLQNWQLSLAVIAFMPVSIWLSAKIAGRSETYFHQMFKQSGELYSVVEEAYTNYATTKAYNLEEHCAERHAKINDARRVSEAKATYLSAIVQPVIAASNSLAYIAINLLGGWLIVRQGVPVGVIVTLVLFARQFSEPLEQISNGLSTLQQAKAAAQRVVDLLELPEEAPIEQDLPAGGDGSVEFRHVDFSYEPDTELIRDLNLHVEKGQHVAIVGPTGAGKTTIVNLLMRFYDVDSGSILLSGHDVADYSRASTRSRFGMVLQDTWLFGGTIAEKRRLRQAGRNAGGDHPRLRRGVLRPFHPHASAGLRHRHRQRYLVHLLRPEAAADHCAGAARAAGTADPRRGDVQRRHAHGAAHPEGDGPPHARPDLLHHRPPPVHDRGRGPHPRPPRRPHRRTRHPPHPPGEKKASITKSIKASMISRDKTQKNSPSGTPDGLFAYLEISRGSDAACGCRWTDAHSRLP